MNPNPEQIKSAIRWLVATFGGVVAGWLAHGGYVTTQQVTDVINGPAFFSFAFSVASGVIGLLVHKQSNAVAVVTRIAADPGSPVVGVVAANNAAGHALVSAIDHTGEIAVASTTAASAIANDNVPALRAAS